MFNNDTATAPMLFDLKRARRETPGCDHVMHLNNAAASLMPDSVLDAVFAHLRNEAMLGAYEAAAQAPVSSIFQSASSLLGCDPSEVAITDNATRSWNAAFNSVPLVTSDRILVSRSEFVNSSLTLLQASQRSGISIEVIPCDETGQLSVSHLRSMMDERVRLIVATHMPTNGGLVNPVADIGQVAREWNCLYLLDASQSIGQIPINVKSIGCHMLSAPGRKYLRGPRGTGILYVSNAIMDRLKVAESCQEAGTWPTFDQYIPHGDARRYEIGECSVALRPGLGAAIEYALGWGIENIWDRVHTLGELMQHSLDVLVNGYAAIQHEITLGLNALIDSDIDISHRFEKIAVEVVFRPANSFVRRATPLVE